VALVLLIGPVGTAVATGSKWRCSLVVLFLVVAGTAARPSTSRVGQPASGFFAAILLALGRGCRGLLVVGFHGLFFT
jgi:hypothetical protein